MKSYFYSPRKGGRRSISPNKRMNNGDSDEGISSAATTTRTLSTAATDVTSSSGASSIPPMSPTKSPTKSPRKKGPKAKDVMSLPKPYSLLNTDKIKKWHKELVAGNEVGADDEDEQEFFNSIHFTNAFVLKINQLVKQVRPKYM